MQVTPTLNEGLKREFRVVVPVTELLARVETRIDELKGRMNIPGFRPGKVPVAHIKRVHGKAVTAEVVEALVGEVNTKLLEENKLKLASEPSVRLPEDEVAAKGIFEGTADLDYVVAFEVLPEIPATSFDTISIEKPVAEVSDKEIDETLANMAKSQAPFAEKTKGKSAEGDRLTISFVGTMDGVAFDGGTGEDIDLVIGSNSFIPGFEPQLIGLKKGETKTVNVTFPGNYMAPNLAGKDASFEVTVNKIEAPGERAIDEEFAKMVGFEDVEKLRAAVSERLSAEFADASRRVAKRALLDKLDEMHKFDLPETLVAQEFEVVWRQVTNDMTARNATFESENTTEEKAKAEYKAIAERRVRLGLLLADIGEKNTIQVTDEEVTRALVARAREFPGQEQQVWDYYRKNAQALASLRAPIFEEKVVDHILSLAKVKEKKVSKDKLLKAVNDEDDAAA